MKFPAKHWILVAFVVGLIAIAFATRGIDLFGQTAAARPQMSEQAFKNIQVLKGIPVDEFMGTMGLFSAALSVCCGDCHQGAGTSNPKWEADPPRKQVARKMVQMVNNINRDNFGGRQVVTCWTCHRGSQRPSATPPMDLIYGDAILYPMDVLPAAQDNQPSPDQIFEKYIQALGGAQRVAALTSYVAKGTTQPFGEEKSYPADIYAKAPNQLAMVVHEQEGDMARTFDGREGWVMLPLTVIELYPLNASALEGARLDGQLSFPGGIKQSLTNWHVSYPSTIDGRDVYVVQGSGASGMVASFYFDKQSGLLKRVIRYANSAMGRVPTQWDYSDYRAVAGVMIPFKFSYSWISGREEYTLTDVQPNAPVNVSVFGKPVQKAK